MEPPHNRGQTLPGPARHTLFSGQKMKVRQIWTPEEDRILSRAAAKETPRHGTISWHKVAAHLPGRNNKACRKRWHYSVSHTIKKGTWTKEEDEKLLEAVDKHGARWSKVAAVVGSRNGDQCWKRWYDCLDPRIDKSPWMAEEDVKLLQEVAATGRNWSEIVTKHFPNRTSLSAKNRYSILQRRRENAPDTLVTASHGTSPTPTPIPVPMMEHPVTPNMSHLSPATGFGRVPDGFDVHNNTSFLQQSSPTLEDSWCAEDLLSEASTPKFSPNLDWVRWSPCPSTLALSSGPQGFVNSGDSFNAPLYSAPSMSSIDLFPATFDPNDCYVPGGVNYYQVTPPSIQVYPPMPTGQCMSRGFEFLFPVSWES